MSMVFCGFTCVNVNGLFSQCLTTCILLQIDKATQLKTQPSLPENEMIGSEDEDEDVDEVLFGEEDESPSSSEDNDD